MDVDLTQYQAALQYLFARTTGGYKFGLERTLTLLDALGNPHRGVPALHVAGTNGKGSAVATAAGLLRAKGLRVGTYTSPHLVDFRERIVADDAPISGERVVEFVERWTPLVERIGATFFEATTVLAFAYFREQAVDVALIETGLGGRLDTTNVVDPVSAGVVSIGFDHMEYLGDTLEAIAAEKAGIFKPGRPAVIGEPDPQIRALLARLAREAGASSVRVVAERTRIDDLRVDAHGTEFTLAALGDRRRLRTPLTGVHQAPNLAFTLEWLDAAGPRYAVSLADAEAHLAAISIPGRFQQLGRYLFDVAHNADGARVLSQTLSRVRPPTPVVAVVCALRDKEWRDMLLALRAQVAGFVLTNAPTAPESRAWDLAEVAEFARREQLPFAVEPDFDRALALGAEQGATVLVTGSFHTVGDAMARLHVSPLAQ
ncbi:MAG: folylpolyglutamate synthase/dihydrofolate synthase family protein [Gemmatimonadaceae bacterium]|nr:folylpolyglutamate synthase/dihydrofolate synthase family protein [Gemmatimonadaceae bacterium]